MGAGVVEAAADWRPRRRKKKMVAMRAARVSATMGTATPIAIFVPWEIPPVLVGVGGGVVADIVGVVVGRVLLEVVKPKRLVATLIGKSVKSAALYLTTTAKINRAVGEVTVLPTERYAPPEDMGLKYGTVRGDETKVLHTYGA
jgi:hypothetical protein